MPPRKRFDLPFDARQELCARLESLLLGRGGLACAYDDAARIAFQAGVWSAYADFAPFRRRYLREVLGLGAEPR